MLNNFIYADTKALFLNELNAGNVLDEAIVFIEDTKEIWNHGHYFAGDCGFDQNLFSEVQTAVAALQADKVNRNELSDYAKKTDLPNLSGYLTKDTADKTYSTIAQLNALNDKAAEALDAANTAQTNITTHAADTNNPHDVTKTQIGLGNVENTALSTWTGSNELTTCAKGTIIGSNNIGDQSVKYAETAGSANSSAEAATAGTAGYANSAGSVTNSLTVGTKTFNGSEAVTITASDLGLSSALKYCGTTSTAIKNGDTTKTITIDNKNHTAEPGCTVEYGDKLFTFTASNKWEELGNPGGYKPLQTAVSDPTASGNSTTFIDTISQDTNGKITVTKKNVKFPAAYSLPTASSTTLGGVKIGTDLSINENGVLSAEAHTLHSTPAPADMNSVTTNVTGYVNSPANGPQSASGSSDISGDTNVGSYFVFGNGSNCVSQFFAGYKNDTVEKPGGLYFRKWAVNQGWDGWKEILMVSPDGKLHKGRKNLNLSGINNLTIDGVLTANAATTTVAGLMSATDKQKLDGIASGANAYTHPSSSAAGTKGATADVTGTDGATIKVPKITVDSLGHVTGLSEYTYTSKNTTYSNATQSAAGLMTAADKKKVDELGTRAFDSTEYLPLSGGTIAGNGAALLAINRKNGNPVIEFHHNGSLMGRYGFATDGTPIGVVAGSQVTLIHSGNIGSYKAGDSTLLGGKAVNEFAYVGTYPEQGNYNYSMQSGIYRSNGKEEGLPNINSGCSVIHTNFDSKAANQLFLDKTKDFFAYRRKTGGAWSAWKTIAFTDSDITGNAAGLKHSNGTIAAVVNSSGNVTLGPSDWAGSKWRFFVDKTAMFQAYNDNMPTLGNAATNVIHIGQEKFGMQLWATYGGVASIQSGRIDGTATAYNLSLQPLGGNVGIGTTNPAYTLDVNGVAKTLGLRCDNVCIECDANGNTSGYGGEINRLGGGQLWIQSREGGLQLGNSDSVTNFNGSVTMSKTLNVSGAVTINNGKLYANAGADITGDVKMGDATIAYDSNEKCIKFSF